MFDEHTHAVDNRGRVRIIPGVEALETHATIEEAIEAAKHMSLKNPKGKVLIFEGIRIIEPRKVEFAEKSFNSAGELLT
jgi:hypothetical protein